ncbi:MAG: SOS response-associated peptidase [Deltaproteobacteria bacterium]|nr:SOS response-associated peptidase [Deltaproteobacteria bacterium]
MCGRFGLKTTFSTLARLLRADPVAPHEWGPDFNVAPTDPAPVVLAKDDGTRALDLFRWGLVPFWANGPKDPRVGARIINARADGIADKPAFRDGFQSRRLLVPVSGWFEWETRTPVGKGKAAKIPHWFHPPEAQARPEDALFMLAGVGAKWTDKETGEVLRTFSIVTTESAGVAAGVHDRMPVILDGDGQRRWLAKDTPKQGLLELLVPYRGPVAEHVVSQAVNNVRSDGPELIAPVRDLLS